MASQSLRVVARIKALAGKTEELRLLLKALVEATRKEVGCLRYDLLQNKQDLGEFTFVEEWKDDAALAAHLSSSHVQEAFRRAPELVAEGPDIRQYDAVS